MIILGLIYTLIILILLAFAIYEHIHAQSLSLPISPVLTLLTILLPLLSASNTAYLYRVSTNPSLSREQSRPKLLISHFSSTITPNPSNPNQQLQVTHPNRPPLRARRPQSASANLMKPTLRSLLPSLSSALQTTQLVLSVVLLTLATSSLTSSPFSITPEGSSIELCALEQAWSHFFRSHDADTIRKIQDTLSCCGFRSPKHMSWPFPSGQPGEPGKGPEQCMNMWPERKEGCAGKWEGEFKRVMGGELGVVVGVLVVQVLGWGVGRYFQARHGGMARAGGENGRVGRNGEDNGGRGRAGNGNGNGNGNNGWWNKLLQSFGVPHGDEDDTQAYGGSQRRPLLGEGHVGIEEVDDDDDDEDEDEDGEERDVERGPSDEEDRPEGGRGYGSAANSRVQPSRIHHDVADPWADGN
ncbi:hypothetical protein QBC32DRAFT_153433 [Pseudoneurospora amorphoporcata]|uniref:Tetraspanin Tsp3 n=1 Tax=Pseudoneurospora amorphoporcata TaxID=241081 RepID=A0AAN6SG95_9PEZI|nr:hypothetical protein QBC32DRAFT_153433 [Pseudoneurospora amorphoporcata]